MRTKDEIKALLWECCEKTESNEGVTMTLVFDKVADLVIELSNQPTDLLSIEIVEEPNYEQKFRECFALLEGIVGGLFSKEDNIDALHHKAHEAEQFIKANKG